MRTACRLSLLFNDMLSAVRVGGQQVQGQAVAQDSQRAGKPFKQMSIHGQGTVHIADQVVQLQPPTAGNVQLNHDIIILPRRERLPHSDIPFGALDLNHRLIRCMLYAILITGLLAGCSKTPATPTATPQPVLVATITPEALPTVTATHTPAPLLAVLLAGPGADTTQAGVLQTALNEIITSAGLRWQVRQQLTPAELGPAVHLVVALPPDPGLAALAAAAPGTQFLAVGIPGLEPAANLSVVGAQGPRPTSKALSPATSRRCSPRTGGLARSPFQTAPRVGGAQRISQRGSVLLWVVQPGLPALL